MNRRDLLGRLAADGPAKAGVIPAEARTAPGPGIDREVDVSAVSGAVPLASLVEGDLQAQLNEEYVDQLPADLGASDLKVEVGEETDAVVPSECDDRCCGSAGCREPGNCCLCIECP